MGRAALAEASRVADAARVRESATAWQIEVIDARVWQPKPAGGPAGTSVTVRDLFGRQPARRRSSAR